MRIYQLLIGLLSIIVSLSELTGEDQSPKEHKVPEAFVDIKQFIPSIHLELRYYGTNNFVGLPIDGYTSPNCWVTKPAAENLKRIQDEIKTFGLGLKIFDAYRPQQAVDHFVRWIEHPDDQTQKTLFYPNLDKTRLIKDGYIAERSGHSRGGALDLTLVELPTKNGEPARELDMGTPFDFFGPESWTAHPKLTPQQRRNRLLLKSVMERHGFRNYSKEWWHFSLRNEPFPETYFNFPTGATKE